MMTNHCKLRSKIIHVREARYILILITECIYLFFIILSILLDNFHF